MSVNQLNFGRKTAKRVAWEAWEFTVVGPHQVRVTNASYGFLKDEHAYVVGVKERDGQPVPAECECPADLYREEYDCKHKVALAAEGGLPVLKAALAFETPATPPDDPIVTVKDKLTTDGGVPGKGNLEPNCDCQDRFPCWECYRTKRRELPG